MSNSSDNPSGFLTKEEEVFTSLVAILNELIGAEELEIIGVYRHSRFVDDLMMESIQIVVFAEQVDALYGDRVDLITWISDMPMKKLLGLSVGDVSKFIATRI